MVARSEGFKAEEIKIVIGKDGGLIMTDERKGKFLFNVPAPIEDNDLHKEICIKLDQLIKLYENKELDNKLIEETQIKNGYFLKKIMLKYRLIAK